MTQGSWYLYLGVFFFGAAGCLSRYWLSSILSAHFGKSFPFGTLAVNVIGSLFIGFIAEVAGRESGAVSPILRTALISGFLGGFTTFSAFSLETVQMLSSGKIESALLNIGASLGICFLTTWLGILIGKQV